MIFRTHLPWVEVGRYGPAFIPTCYRIAKWGFVGGALPAFLYSVHVAVLPLHAVVVVRPVVVVDDHPVVDDVVVVLVLVLLVDLVASLAMLSN